MRRLHLAVLTKFGPFEMLPYCKNTFQDLSNDFTPVAIRPILLFQLAQNASTPDSCGCLRTDMSYSAVDLGRYRRILDNEISENIGSYHRCNSFLEALF